MLHRRCRREVKPGEDEGRADPHQREGDRRPRLLAARQVIGERHHDKAAEADEIEPEEDLAGENRHHGGSFEKMIVPEAANMPPTPWQTDTLAPSICAGATLLNMGANGVYPLMMRTRPFTVAETPIFISQAADLWSDAERFDFVDFIARNPEVGELIPGSGGVRKIRWTRRGMGKRSGVRIAYFYHDPGMPLYLLMIYAKARHDDLSPDAKRTVQRLVARLKQAYGR